MMGGVVSVLIWFNYQHTGLPWWLSGKEPACQCRRYRFNPWIGKILWRRKWQSTPVFLPGEFHGQRILMVYTPGLQKNQTWFSNWTTITATTTNNTKSSVSDFTEIWAPTIGDNNNNKHNFETCKIFFKLMEKIKKKTWLLEVLSWVILVPTLLSEVFLSSSSSYSPLLLPKTELLIHP